MSLQVKYKLLKNITILYGALSIPADVWIGFLLGSGNFKTAFLILGVQVILTFADGYAWVWVLEQMAKDKVKFGVKYERKRINSKNK